MVRQTLILIYSPGDEAHQNPLDWLVCRPEQMLAKVQQLADSYKDASGEYIVEPSKIPVMLVDKGLSSGPNCRSGFLSNLLA